MRCFGFAHVCTGFFLWFGDLHYPVYVGGLELETEETTDLGSVPKLNLRRWISFVADSFFIGIYMHIFGDGFIITEYTCMSQANPQHR
jgi:hypothetical protein